MGDDGSTERMCAEHVSVKLEKTLASVGRVTMVLWDFYKCPSQVISFENYSPFQFIIGASDLRFV